MAHIVKDISIDLKYSWKRDRYDRQSTVLEKFLQVFICNNISHCKIIRPGHETVVTRTNQ